MCNIRSKEHFNISDGRNRTARDAPCYILPEHSRSVAKLSSFKFGTIERLWQKDARRRVKRGAI